MPFLATDLLDTMPSIILPENLSGYVNGAVKLTFPFSSLSEAVSYLELTYPSLYKVLFNLEGETNGFISFYLNSKPVTDCIREPIPVAENDCLEIVVAVAGG